MKREDILSLAEAGQPCELWKNTGWTSSKSSGAGTFLVLPDGSNLILAESFYSFARKCGYPVTMPEELSLPVVLMNVSRSEDGEKLTCRLVIRTESGYRLLVREAPNLRSTQRRERRDSEHVWMIFVTGFLREMGLLPQPEPRDETRNAVQIAAALEMKAESDDPVRGFALDMLVELLRGKDEVDVMDMTSPNGVETAYAERVSAGQPSRPMMRIRVAGCGGGWACEIYCDPDNPQAGFGGHGKDRNLEWYTLRFAHPSPGDAFTCEDNPPARARGKRRFS